MTWEFDLRHDGDVKLLRVGNDFTNIRLAVMTAAMKMPIAILGSKRGIGRNFLGIIGRKVAMHLRELGVLANFQTPRLAINKMPVQPIQLLRRHRIEKFQQKILWLKMP